MKLHSYYRGLTLRPATAVESAAFEGLDARRGRPLRVVLESPQLTGLVACSRVTVCQADSPVDESWAPGEILMSVMRSPDPAAGGDTGR